MSETLPHFGVKQKYRRKDRLVIDENGTLVKNFKSVRSAKHYMRTGEDFKNSNKKRR